MIKIPARVKIFDAIMIAIFASYSLLPVFWVITTSFKTNEELTRNGTLALPEHFSSVITRKHGKLRAFQTTSLTVFL